MLSDKDDVAISVKGLYKSFSLPHEKHTSIKGSLLNKIKGGRKTYEKQQVLKDINFEIKKGEFFGIVGRNGSGKSTLLKLLAGIYSPDKGSITVNGKLTPFIELGVGFNPELTGRENVFLNGALLGFTRHEMLAMYDEIVGFAELERFMDQKLKNYSSGMQVRLAFSIAIRANTDILVLDEVLAVGDEAFQRKCFSYFSMLKKTKKTVVLVTHDMSAVQQFCTSAILVDSGKISEEGNKGKVTRRYQELNRASEETSSDQIKDHDTNKHVNQGTIKTVITNKKGINKKTYRPNDSIIRVENTIVAHRDLTDVFFGFTIWKESGEPVYWYTTEHPNPAIGDLVSKKARKVYLDIQNIFGDGKYFISVSVKSSDRSKEYIIIDNITAFEVVGRGKNGWMLHPEVKVRIE